MKRDKTLELSAKRREILALPPENALEAILDHPYPVTLVQSMGDRVDRAYHSANETPLTQAELRAFLHENNLIEGEAAEPFQPVQRF